MRPLETVFVLAMSIAGVHSSPTGATSTIDIGPAPTLFNLMAINASSTTEDGQDLNGQLLYGSGKESSLAGFGIPSADGPNIQQFSLDPTTGYLYDGYYPLTVAPHGYSSPGSGASGGYPWTTALYGRGWSILTCYVDDSLLLHCGLPSPVGPDSPNGITYGEWWCTVPLYGTGIGCYLFGGLDPTPAGTNDNGISINLKVVAV